MHSHEPVNRRESIIGRIMSRVQVDPKTQCWVWQGPDSGKGRGGGYGRTSLNSQTVAVHLVSFTHFHGYIPRNRQVDHTCNNRRCCNPDHLELVTHKRNQKLRDIRRRS